jgi:FtsZ-binding cell division protein ZapB
MTPARLATLSRALVETRRFASDEREAIEQTCKSASASVAAESRPQVLAEAERLWPVKAGPRAAALATGETPVLGSAQELLRQKASLELKLQSAADKLREVEAGLKREQDEHKQAMESLALQQKRIKELQDDRARLLSQAGELESKLRLQINETEQVQLRYEKLKASRQTMGDQATELQAQINALKEENQRLRQQAEEKLKERDQKVSAAQSAAAEAESETASSAFERLWAKMREVVPEVFIETHVPTERTFERVCEAFTECLRAFAVLELHVHHFLKDLRQVGTEGDKLSHFYMMFSKNAGLLETLRDYLSSGRRSGNFTNLLRAHQAWSRALASGLYKVIVRSPVILAEEMNPRSWPIKSSFTVTEEAAIGRYYKETAAKQIPEKVGTEMRKHAADMAYEDYNELMKRK